MSTSQNKNHRKLELIRIVSIKLPCETSLIIQIIVYKYIHFVHRCQDRCSGKPKQISGRKYKKIFKRNILFL